MAVMAMAMAMVRIRGFGGVRGGDAGAHGDNIDDGRGVLSPLMCRDGECRRRSRFTSLHLRGESASQRQGCGPRREGPVRAVRVEARLAFCRPRTMGRSSNTGRTQGVGWVDDNASADRGLLQVRLGGDE